jgi:dihydrofolate reductase
MRKLIVANMMSLDGYFEGPNKDVLALFSYRRKAYPKDDSFDVYNAERLRAADTLLLGRISYLMFKSYWPTVADDPKVSPVEREISRLNNKIEKVVISNSLTESETDPWRNTRIIHRKNAHKQIAALKRQSGKDILVFGSHVLWNDLLEHDLLDELHLMTGPVVLGAGTPLFVGQQAEKLRLIDAFTWDGSGNVLARYEVRHKKA